MHARARRGRWTGRPGRLPALVIALVAVLALAVACGEDDDDDRAGTAPSVPAEAELLALGGGTTTLSPHAPTVEELRDAGVALEPAGTATLEDGEIVLPITRGAVSPDTFRGAFRHRDAGVAFVGGGERVDLTGLVVSTGDGFVASNDIGRTIGRLELSTLVAERQDDVVRAGGMVLYLGSQTADLLNERLDTDVFDAEMRLGTLTTVAEPVPVRD